MRRRSYYTLSGILDRLQSTYEADVPGLEATTTTRSLRFCHPHVLVVVLNNPVIELGKV